MPCSATGKAKHMVHRHDTPVPCCYSILNFIRLHCTVISDFIECRLTLNLVVVTHYGRCLQPTTERVHATFSLLLTSVPVLEPTQRHLGVVLGREKHVNYSWGDASAEEEAGSALGEPSAVLDLDLDDKIFFPPDQSEIDISKHIRDAVHLEVPLKVLCSAGSSCKGMCLDCGVNLNTSPCACSGTSDSHPASQKAKGREGGQTEAGSSSGARPGSGLGKKKGALSLKEQLEALYTKDQ